MLCIIQSTSRRFHHHYHYRDYQFTSSTDIQMQYGKRTKNYDDYNDVNDNDDVDDTFNLMLRKKNYNLFQAVSPMRF